MDYYNHQYLGQSVAQSFQLNEPFVYHEQGQAISFAQFWQDVYDKTLYLQASHTQQYVLWCHDSSDFFSWLWACVLAHKQAILPPALTQDFQHMMCLNEQTDDLTSQKAQGSIVDLNVDWEQVLYAPSIIFYTSGSTGKPKAITRTMAQLLLEGHVIVKTLALPSSFVVLASVSHQHLYGLTFQLIVPFIARQAFYSQQLIYPEHIEQKLQEHRQKIAVSREMLLMSSPALLKRCIGVFDFALAKMIFSSGGRLEDGIRPYYAQGICEIYGSSETGAMAYRYQDHALWQSFPDVDIALSELATLSVKTPRAYQEDWIVMHDLVRIDGSLFELLGRRDRIVKLEEKRLSLDEIEAKINQLDDVVECYTLLVEHENRAFLSVAVVLNASAKQRLQQYGKREMVKTLKQSLAPVLEPIARPKHWRFISEIPRNTQSKINREWVKNLFLNQQYPYVLSQSQTAEQVDLRLEFAPELHCFKGHFEGFPIYPGVGQLGFLIHFAQQYWSDLHYCCGFEQVKFQELIRPYDVLVLNLKRDQHKIIFQLKNDAQHNIASGRLLFEINHHV